MDLESYVDILNEDYTNQLHDLYFSTEEEYEDDEKSFE